VEEVPDYLKIIKNPMDFSKMSKKLQAGEYTSLSQFEVREICPCFFLFSPLLSI
jgi:hypothetical protein